MKRRQFRKFTTDRSAVSPVIGVILMVAITVILAAVIGTFVLGIGDTAQSRSPQAAFEFDFDYDSSTASCWDTPPANADGVLTISHESGEAIDRENVLIKAKDTWPVTSGGTGECKGPETLESGSTITILVTDDTTVQVVWEGDGGESSATLGKWDGEDSK